MSPTLVLLALWTLLALACERAPTAPPPDPPPPPFVAPLEALSRAGETRTYLLEHAGEADRWELRSGIASAEVTDDGLELQFEGNDPFLSRRILPRVHGIAAIEVETAEPTRKPLRLFLRVAGRESEHSSIDTVPLSRNPRVQRAELSGEGWQRLEIEEVRIDPDPSERALTLKRLTLVPIYGEQRLLLRSEARSCVRAASVATQLRAPAGALLRFGIGVVGTEGPPDEYGEFRAILRDAAGRVAQIVERRVPIGRSGWVDVLSRVPDGDAPFDLRLSIRRMPTGGVLESCFEQPDLQIGSEGGGLPNVLLVSLDTFRADHLEHAPFLSRLSVEGRSFLRVWASSNWTLPSHVSLMTSLPALEHQVPAVGVLPPYPGARIPKDQPTLAKRMRQAGYLTAATTEAGFLSEHYGFGDGFDRFQAFSSTDLEPGGAALRHVEFLRDVLADRGSRPYFAFVHSFKAHDYWLNTPEYRAFVGPEYAAWASHPSFARALRASSTKELPEAYLRELYAAGIRRVDEILEEIVTVLLNETDDAPLLVIVLSDHGESFNEHLDVWHHGSSVFEEQLRVPLVVWSNRDPRLRGEVNAETSIVDVAPSLLAYLGLEVPETFRGERDRFAPQPSAQRRYPVLASRPSASVRAAVRRIDQMIVVEGWKYLRLDRYDGSLVAESCFNLRVDPREQTDLLGEGAQACREFPNRLADAFRLFSTGTVLVASAVPLELAGEARDDEEPIVAVRPTHPSREAITNLTTGELHWDPPSENALLAISPAASTERLVLRRIADAELDETIDLRSLQEGERRRIPQPTDAEVPSVEFSARALRPALDESAAEIDRGLEAGLRALGYID